MALLVEEARAEGEGFVPECGDILAVPAIPLETLDESIGNDAQPIAMELPASSEPCP